MPRRAVSARRAGRLGYKHIALNGQKGYHGVAIVSRHAFAEEQRRDFCAKGDSRHVAVTLKGKAQGLKIHNFYVPAGGDEPDPEINDKFAHKLAFVDEMARVVRKRADAWRARRSWSATSTSPRSNTTCGATRR